MRAKDLEFQSGFRVAIGNHKSQAAEMVIQPGEAEGGPQNRHRGSDQWLYVQSGNGTAIVNGQRHQLRRGSLILIERGETHEIRNTGRRVLRTLNFYVPPASTSKGGTLRRGRT
jgi:mannose-6-phosphate isomerase-like protein (cupin superfamily)